MNFSAAYEALKQGAKIKRKHWAGYWCKENNTIVMYCKDGTVLNITDTKDVFYTLDNIMADDWGIVDYDKDLVLDIQTFTFGEAIRRMKNGERVARTGWNGKNQYIELASNIAYINPQGESINAEHLNIGNKAIAFVGTAGVQMGWLASQADMLAEDWHVAK